MNQNTNEKPTGTAKEERLALAFGRVLSEIDDLSPEWLGADYVDEQRRTMEHAAKERGLEIVGFAVGYGRGGPGTRSVLSALWDLARERGIRTLLVPNRRYLAGLKSDEPPYFWERAFTGIGVEIVEAPPEDWL